MSEVLIKMDFSILVKNYICLYHNDWFSCVFLKWRQFHKELGDLGQLGLHIASFPYWSAKNDSITTVIFPCYSGAASLVAQLVKYPPANAADKRHAFNPWIRKIPWRRKWQPTPVFSPGESYGQRNLAGYSLWCCKESDTNEQPTIYFKL